jgi:large subunit ribosomal protein L20
MNGLKKNGIAINRKMLAEMAVREPESFSSLLKQAAGKAQE